MQQNQLISNLGGILYKLTGESLTKSQLEMIMYVLSIKPNEYESIIQQLLNLDETRLNRFREMITNITEKQQHFEYHESLLVFKYNQGYDYIIKASYLTHDDQIIYIQKAIQCGPVIKITQEQDQIVITYGSEISVKIAKLYFEQLYETLNIDVTTLRQDKIQKQAVQKETTVVQQPHEFTQQPQSKGIFSQKLFDGNKKNCICGYSLNKEDNATETLQNLIQDLQIQKNTVLNVYCLKSQKQNILIECKTEVYSQQYKDHFSKIFKQEGKAYKYRIDNRIEAKYFLMQHWEQFFNDQQDSRSGSTDYEQWRSQSYEESPSM